MALLDCCGKTILILLNIIVILIGLLLLGLGLFLKFGVPALTSSPTARAYLGLGSSAMPSASLDNDTSSLTSTPASASLLLDDFISALQPTLNVLINVLIALGVFMLAVGVFGCCGACCSARILLAAYATIVLLLFVAKVIVLGIWLNKSMDDKILDRLEDTVKTKYAGPFALNPESLVINLVMLQLGCCGVKNYTEFLEADAWNRTFEYNLNGQTVMFEQKIPQACCRGMGFETYVSPEFYLNCTITPTLSNANIDTSCHKATQNKIDENKVAVFGVYFAILAFELICAAIAIYILVRMRQKEKKKKARKRVRSPQYQYDTGPPVRDTRQS